MKKKAEQNRDVAATDAAEDAVGKRPDDETYERRIQDARKLWVLHGSKRQAARELMQRHGVCRRTADRYIAEVARRWQADATDRGEDPRLLVEEHRQRFLAIHRAAWEEMNLKIASDTAKSLMALDGLPVKRVEHSGPNGGPIPLKVEDLSDADLDARIAELSAKVGGAG